MPGGPLEADTVLTAMGQALTAHHVALRRAEIARRAVLTLCSRHHLLLVGPPGTGKTMLAQRFVGLRPRLNPDQALALAAIRSVAGRSPAARALSTVPVGAENRDMASDQWAAPSAPSRK